jgi:PAS domain S-box-containing protein
VIVTDVGGRIIVVNAQAERLFGYRREELVGRLVEVLIPVRRPPGGSRRPAGLLGPEPPLDGLAKLRGRRKDGTDFPAEIVLWSVEMEDGHAVAATIRDATARPEGDGTADGVDRRSHAAPRLEGMRQLAAGAAHDFNNILMVIGSYAWFLAEELTARAEIDTGRGEEWGALLRDVAQVQRAVERAGRLTDQLASIARRTAGGRQLLDLDAVVADLEPLLQSAAGEQVELVVSLSPELWLVAADRGQMEQMLVNVAANAGHAMPDGGLLVIDTENVVVSDGDAVNRSGAPPGRYVRVRMDDTGAGMSKAVRDRAFYPFFTTKSRAESSGLGLAIVHAVVTDAGGHAEIESQPGLGTTFSAYLPAVPPQGA